LTKGAMILLYNKAHLIRLCRIWFN